MTAGTCRELAELPPGASSILDGARRAVLATISFDGAPHAVPVCWARRGEELVTAVDHKPKSGRELARIRNVSRDGRASMLFDRYSETWEELGWVMVTGSARLDVPGSASAELADRYEQYRRQPPEGDVIALMPQRVSWWTWM
jgi:PPOX class probable F420-dependent enzyme